MVIVGGGGDSDGGGDGFRGLCDGDDGEDGLGGSSDFGDELGDVVMNSIALVNARMFVRCGENSDIGDVMSDELVMVIMIYLILKMRVYMYAFTTKSRIK